MLPYYVIVPILIAVFLYVFSGAKAARVIAIAAQAVLAGFAVYLFFLSKEGNIVMYIGNYDSVMGITLRADTLSSVFVALTAFAFLIASLYSFSDNDSKLFWFLLFIWEGLLIGVFLTRDFFNIFVLAEVATVVVSILVMYNRDNRSMYDGMFYLMISIVAMQFYLFGVGYVYKLTGVLDMEAAAAVLSGLDRASLALPYALIITAICLKCALMPLFSWLPKAHGSPSAPTSVSALLSGIHIKSGVYLFMRFQSVFQEVDASGLFLVIGIATGIAGFLLAMSQSDIKLLLAYSTVSQVGLIIASLSIGDAYAYTGGLYHMINHTLFKSALFMGAGVIIKAYGTRRLSEVQGLMRRMPLVGAATVLAVLGITGAPLFNGSISKYFIVSGTNWLVTALLVLINLGTIITFMKYSTMLFGRRDARGRVPYKGGYHHVAAGGSGGGLAGEVEPGSEPVVVGEPGIESVSEPVLGDTIPEPGSDAQERIPISKQASILILGAICFVGGIFGEEFIAFLFNVQVSVDAAGYLEKIGFFVASVVVGFFVYRYFVRKSGLIDHVRKVEIGFRGSCISLGAFFAVVIVVVGLL